MSSIATVCVWTQNGEWLRTFSVRGDKTELDLGLHKHFGLISNEAASQRAIARKRAGLFSSKGWICKFRVLLGSTTPLEITSVEGCKVAKLSDLAWTIETSQGNFKISSGEEPNVSQLSLSNEQSRELKIVFVFLTLAALLFLLAVRFLGALSLEMKPVEIEPVLVQIQEERLKPVAVPAPESLSLVKQTESQTPEVKRAIDQNLGFLGLIGRKDLNKALGGAPQNLDQASPGAGSGGKEGSGGELLVGLGQGVRHTTVGNSGVAGLGGVGTKGRGGGAGGYGNSLIGSGEGRAISSIPVSQDLVLEGGLDRSVIQATIAKYLSQIRACYERGLARNAGLSGQVTMSFEINPQGLLNFAHVARSTLGDSEVESCISGRMLTWKFPKPLGGTNVKVTYPFLLRPAGG